MRKLDENYQSKVFYKLKRGDLTPNQAYAAWRAWFLVIEGSEKVPYPLPQEEFNRVVQEWKKDKWFFTSGPLKSVITQIYKDYFEAEKVKKFPQDLSDLYYYLAGVFPENELHRELVKKKRESEDRMRQLGLPRAKVKKLSAHKEEKKGCLAQFFIISLLVNFFK
jgi:hypothetical protein